MPRTATNRQLTTATTKKTFDFATRYAAPSTVVTINDPASTLAKDVDTGVRIRILSIYSKEAREAAVAAQAAIQLDAAGEPIAGGATPDTLLEQTIAITTEWWVEGETTDQILIDGEFVKCTPDRVRALYTDPRTKWVQRQVQAVYLDLARFFDAPKTS